MIIGGGVDIEAADFEVLAVKGAGVFVAAVADWGPVAFLFAADAGEVDIGGELGPSAGLVFVVDFVGKFQQIRCGSNLVRITLLAAALQPSALVIR